MMNRRPLFMADDLDRGEVDDVLGAQSFTYLAGTAERPGGYWTHPRKSAVINYTGRDRHTLLIYGIEDDEGYGHR
jgi:hypothetical protein